MISVLLATFNGEKFLKEQIDSLLEQTYKDFKIIIRDDGSTDSTNEIIESYAVKYPEKISVIKGEPTGSSLGNFFELLSACPEGYAMLCDQDDFWCSDKIEKTFNAMRKKEEEAGENTPILVHTDAFVADSELNIISESFIKFEALSPDFNKLNNLLVQNNVTGCTVMINNALLKLVRKRPENCVMHDWWIALVACLFGETVFVNEPLMYYRQHGNNQVGAKQATGINFIVTKFKNRKNVKKNYLDAYSQANSLLKEFSSELKKEDRKIISVYAAMPCLSKAEKIKAINKYSFKKNTALRNIGQYFSV